jgi:putative ABC transport system substrate-binding protein
MSGQAPPETIRRRALAVLAAGAVPLATAGAQSRAGPRRVGVLWATDSGDYWQGALRGFHDRLQELGYVEGRTVEIHRRFAQGRLDRLPGLARELIALRVEVIVAVAQTPTEAARSASTTVPIVMVQVGDPFVDGLVKSLARPGGNVTGTVSMTPELAGKQVELLHQLAPQARRVAMVGNPHNAGIRRAFANATEAARSLGLMITPFDVATLDEMGPTLARIEAAQPDALLVAADPFVFTQRAALIDLAARMRLPALYTLTSIARDGGLEQPTGFTLTINLRMARAMGLDVPRAILDRTDEIIE